MLHGVLSRPGLKHGAVWPSSKRVLGVPRHAVPGASLRRSQTLASKPDRSKASLTVPLSRLTALQSHTPGLGSTHA